MLPADHPFSWAVFSQAHTPSFQRMMENLGGDANLLLFSGTPNETSRANVRVEAAPPYDRRDLRRRAISWASYAAAAGIRGTRLRGRPFLFLVTNPPILPHVGWLLHRLRGFRYAVLVWDIFPQSIVQAGLLGPHTVPVRTWSALNRLAYSRAEVVITLGHHMAHEIRRDLGAAKYGCRVEVVPNWAETDWIRPIRKAENPFAIQHGQVDRITISYSGNFGLTHGLERLVGAAARLKDEPRISFLLIGGGPGRSAVEREVRRRRASNVKLLDRQPWEMLRHSLTCGDISVVSQVPGTEHYSFPSKTFAALSAGSALLAITRPDSDLGTLVTADDVGVVVPWDDEAGLASAIRNLAQHPAQLRRFQQNARRVAVEQYSASVVERRFRDVLGGLIDPHAPRGNEPAC